MAGTINRHADGEQITVTLRARIAGARELIVAHARIHHGHWSVHVRLPGRQHEPGDRWHYTIAYHADKTLSAAHVTGGFLLEGEPRGSD